MKLVHQTTFYPRGNCYAACVASILEIDIEDVPDFWHTDEGVARDGYPIVRNWLARRGLGILRILPMFDGVWVAPVLPTDAEVFFIASGYSPRHQCGHAVVWGARAEQTYPAHDPHPKGGFLKGDPKSFDIIIPLGTVEVLPK